ncbi:hypothetical protein BKA81DRAFT_215032 [Phyllosticta paracitricarpa]|uniref:Uncharacterized protein n=1 Tax=Phyllosticta paracitricarpa TaxID=2016321 RepID=A0ABR1MST5_9PEZI
MSQANTSAYMAPTKQTEDGRQTQTDGQTDRQIDRQINVVVVVVIVIVVVVVVVVVCGRSQSVTQSVSSTPQAKGRLPAFLGPNFSKLQPTTLPSSYLLCALCPLLCHLSPSYLDHLVLFLSRARLVRQCSLLCSYRRPPHTLPSLLFAALVPRPPLALLLTARPLVWLWVLSCLSTVIANPAQGPIPPPHTIF